MQLTSAARLACLPFGQHGTWVRGSGSLRQLARCLRLLLQFVVAPVPGLRLRRRTRARAGCCWNSTWAQVAGRVNKLDVDMPGQCRGTPRISTDAVAVAASNLDSSANKMGKMENPVQAEVVRPTLDESTLG